MNKPEYDLYVELAAKIRKNEIALSDLEGHFHSGNLSLSTFRALINEFFMRSANDNYPSPRRRKHDHTR